MLGAKVLDEIEDLIEDQSVGTLFPLVLGHLNLSYNHSTCHCHSTSFHLAFSDYSFIIAPSHVPLIIQTCTPFNHMHKSATCISINHPTHFLSQKPYTPFTLDSNQPFTKTISLCAVHMHTHFISTTCNH